MTDVVAFENLPTSDLMLGTIYVSGSRGNVGDDPITRLVPVGNQGGIRYKGSPARNEVRLAVIYTSLEEAEWPDYLSEETGLLTYYGDNRDPGRDLLDTHRKGNILLKNVFEAAYGTADARALVPPLVLFEKVPPRRDVRFRGLLAPGVAGSSFEKDLQIVWRCSSSGQFENYQAMFTVLNVKRVPHIWISAVANGMRPTEAPDCPPSWRGWVESGTYDVLPSNVFGS